MIQIVDSALADAARRSGDWLVCRPGCTQCCVGVFSINQLDVLRLRQGLAELEVLAPERAARARERAREAVAHLAPEFPGDHATGLLDDGELAEQRFAEFANDEPCPVLDLDHGTCDLYGHRPILCRTFGPPMRTAENNLATCELCFIHASTEEIAACELDPTLPTQEEASNEAFNTTHNVHGQTLIAYALRP